MINVALSGRVDGGLTSGSTMLAGPSKHFKTGFALLMIAAFMKAKPNSICVFYDSEFGAPPTYFKNYGIDTSRVLHIPIVSIEDLKFDMVQKLQAHEGKEEVIFLVDSIGNLASKKELEDAANDKSVADMTRAKAFKSLFRMITPYLTINDSPALFVNHTYKTMDMYPKDIVSGGTAAAYAPDNVWIIGRRQEKIGIDIVGYNFIIKVEKSRFLREGSKIPISVTYDNGMSKWSGLIEVGMELGYIYKPKNGWYRAKNPTTGLDLEDRSYRLKDTNTKAFWEDVFSKTNFAEAIRERYTLGDKNMLEDDEDENTDSTIDPPTDVQTED
tara:strand:- start:1512 stop:2495 length:984 start_codon:yes stop_codon:yes gene_type:complete